MVLRLLSMYTNVDVFCSVEIVSPGMKNIARRRFHYLLECLRNTGLLIDE